MSKQALYTDDSRQAFELSDEQLDAVAGGAGYIKLPGVNGESSSDKHKDEIELQSWSFSVSTS